VKSQSLEQRVEVLEQKVAGLETLPDRMTALEAQISEFRAETRGEFSAVRREMNEGLTMLRGEMHSLIGETRQEMRTLNEETRSYMRTLHEDVVSRIALLDEHLRPARRRRPGKPKPQS
jgi:phage shock protein A